MAEKFQGDDFQCLLTLLQINQDEITRYRDIEWKNAGVFITASVAVIGFVLAYDTRVKSIAPAAVVFSFVLLCGHIYYQIYAHIRYTNQRVVRETIQRALGVDKLKVNGEEVLKAIKPKAHPARTTFMYGFWSHLLPFFLFNAILVGYTYYLTRH